jgi:2-keto-4-pentenoate hydratase/2-oxohepta-3-ene-1,7-dioic acid hydratase in catechol pathway
MEQGIQMKFCSFRAKGEPTYGIADGATVQAVNREFRDRYADLQSVIAADALSEAAAAAVAGDEYELSAVSFDPVIPKPGKIFCVGMNYLAHIKEMGREPPDFPALFIRFPDSLVGHRNSVTRPAASTQYDYEGELAVVIGRAARHVDAARALDFVAGYACFLDGSVRDFQRHTSQFTAGKNFRHSGAFGPWLTTADEIPDPTVLTLRTRINDEVMQQGHVGDLCFGIAPLIEYLSGICQLDPGDVIATGTPSGVGMARDPQRWLEPGDRIQIEIDRVGVLENSVADEYPE